MPARHRADVHGVDACHLARHDDRNAHGAEGHGRGIGDQAQARRIERVEAEADQQRSGDRHRRAEACRAFQEGTEGKADQQHLQALVIGDGQHGRADDVELPGLHHDLVEEHRGHDDPRDRPQAVGKAKARGGERLRHRHAVGKDGHADGQQQRDGGGHVALHAQHRQREEEEQDGQRGRERGQPQAA